VVDAARRESLALTARAGRTAYQPSDLARSRAEALEADRVVGDGTPVAEHEALWARVTIARAVAALPAKALGPLQVLQRHDADHGSDHLVTLAAWLDHPGAPAAAARAIHVHPNTMRYRMHRIADLAGLDLHDPVVRLATRLQLEALVGQSSSQ
jgi:DNA-binding PucR family transcriptional regulator